MTEQDEAEELERAQLDRTKPRYDPPAQKPVWLNSQDVETAIDLVARQHRGEPGLGIAMEILLAISDLKAVEQRARKVTRSGSVDPFSIEWNVKLGRGIECVRVPVDINGSPVVTESMMDEGVCEMMNGNHLEYQNSKVRRIFLAMWRAIDFGQLERVEL